MPKPIVIVSGVVAAVVVVGGVAAIVANKGSSSESTQQSTEKVSKEEVAVNDPSGYYKLFSDPSVTKHPEDGTTFGNGQTLTFEYDGTKTNNDANATLSYQLFYIKDNGDVSPMGGGNIEGKGSGVFTLSDKVFNSSAKNRKGFLELQGTYDSNISDTGQITGKNVKLGMYSVMFDVE